MKIAYITDSGTGKSIEEEARDGVLSLPLQITDGISTYQDMETLSPNECMSLIQQEHVLKTSQPNYGLMDQMFEDLAKEKTDLIIAVPICSGLSGTINTMNALANEKNLKLIAVDTYTTCAVQEYLIHEIKKEMEAGEKELVVAAKVNKVIASCNTMLIPSDLDHLARGGRLTPLAAHMAKLLRIVPLLKINQETAGKIDILDKVRTMRRALDEMIAEMKKSPIDQNWRIYVAYSSNVEVAEKVYHMLRVEFPDARISVIPLCNAVSAHTGQNCVAVQYFEEMH